MKLNKMKKLKNKIINKIKNNKLTFKLKNIKMKMNLLFNKFYPQTSRINNSPPII
jgi:hypothetical protein